jgi:hypothetical protein
MATNVTLDDVDGNYVTVDAAVVKHTASDLMLDSADRRHGGGLYRRALVHDQNDGLTINFDGDYPGGVTITGVADVIPNRPAGAFFPTLVVHGGITYETRGAHLGIAAPATITVNLDEELGKLQSQITDLVTRVTALEAR